MAYSIVQPPFTLSLQEMPKKELLRYFQWFMAAIPERVTELTGAVKSTPGFEAWEPDRTPASLNGLGDWFAGQVETRRRSEEELKKIKDSSPFPIEISGEELTNRTFSLAMDIGMYFSQVLLQKNPFLKWEQRVRNKRYADFGQPVLVGSSPVPLNPVRIAVTLAYGLVKKNKTGKRLREIHDYWARLFEANS